MLIGNASHQKSEVIRAILFEDTPCFTPQSSRLLLLLRRRRRRGLAGGLHRRSFTVSATAAIPMENPCCSCKGALLSASLPQRRPPSSGYRTARRGKSSVFDRTGAASTTQPQQLSLRTLLEHTAQPPPPALMLRRTAGTPSPLGGSRLLLHRLRLHTALPPAAATHHR